MKKKLTLVLAAGLTVASTALAQEAWQTQLREQTQLKSGADFANMSGRGYTLMDVARTNVLNAGASDLVPIQLPPGSSYIVMGVCDNDCLDLDLTVRSGGLDLSTDTTDDDWPVVEITPTSNPAYEINVTMFKCSTVNCGYQLTIWRK